MATNQRILKFRAWKENKEMIFDTSRFIFTMADNLTPSDFIIMQFTGLLDKNKQEIFEGDIIIDHDGIERKIIFKNGMFCFQRSNNSTDLYAKQSEVIGNIYESSELLAK